MVDRLDKGGHLAGHPRAGRVPPPAEHWSCIVAWDGAGRLDYKSGAKGKDYVCG